MIYVAALPSLYYGRVSNSGSELRLIHGINRTDVLGISQFRYGAGLLLFNRPLTYGAAHRSWGKSWRLESCMEKYLFSSPPRN
jgi:hypothetical protein